MQKEHGNLGTVAHDVKFPTPKVLVITVTGEDD